LIQTIFISGTGTSIGKTVISAILTQALEADYWKPVQAGFEDKTDSEWIRSVLTNIKSKVFPEVYKLTLPASPHLAAKKDGIEISLEKIFTAYTQHVSQDKYFIIEGPGGILVPLNEHEQVIDLIRKLNAKVILVSRNYLGSINHSLLTAQVCRQKNIRVLGWIFNDEFMDYEKDIVMWSGFHRLASIGKLENIDKKTIIAEAIKMKEQILPYL